MSRKKKAAEALAQLPDHIQKRLYEIEEWRSTPRAITIKEASCKDYMFCHYAYDHQIAEHTMNNVRVKSEVPVHEDLLNAFRTLNAHLAVICEEIKPEEIGDINNLPEDDKDPLYLRINSFNVSSYKIDGDGSKEGIVLSGYKTLSTGDFLSLQAPKIKWNSSYHFIHELKIAAFDLMLEVDRYMNGKRAKPLQTEMDFEEDYSEVAH